MLQLKLAASTEYCKENELHLLMVMNPTEVVKLSKKKNQLLANWCVPSAFIDITGGDCER